MFFLLLGFLLIPTYSIVLTPDQQTALCVLANQTTIYYPTWNCSTVDQACDWTGIVCDPTNTTILKIGLLGVPTLTYLPFEIGSFPNLTSLAFLETSLTSFPDSVGNLAQLDTLVGDYNFLTDLPVTIFNTNLARISMNGNLFTTIPAFLARMPTLTEIYWSSNLITTLPSDIFQSKSLLIVEVSFNNLESLPSSLFVNVTNSSLLYLGLEQTNLTGTIPSEMYLFSELIELSLGSNRFTGLPSEFGLLSRLEILLLANNTIPSLPTQIGTMSSLLELQVGLNRLTTIPTQIGQINPLLHFEANGNQITFLPTQFGLLTNMTFLDLSINRLNGSIPDCIYQLTRLQYLSLDYNRLTNLGSEIGALIHLTSIFLNENKFQSVPNFTLPALTVLELASNDISGELPVVLTNHKNLTRLVLSYNKFSGTIPTFMGTLTRLQSLFLSGNRYSGYLEYLFLESLMLLDLSFNQLTTLLSDPYVLDPSQSIPRLPNKLAYLDVSYNQISIISFPFPGVLDPMTSILLPPQMSFLDLSGNFLTGTLIVGLEPQAYQDPFVNLVNNRLSRIFLLSSPNGFHPFKVDSPQDVDDCALQVHDCPPHSNCTDGWHPILSYTCTCDPGFEQNLSALPERQCININECALAYSVCPSGFICYDTDGSFECIRDLRGLYIAVPTIVSLMLCGIISFFLYKCTARKYSLKTIKVLPKEVSWSWKQAILAGTWKRKKDQTFLTKVLKKDSVGYDKCTHFLSKLRAGDLQIKQVSAVYNPILVGSFVQTYRVQTERRKNEFNTFFAQDWRDMPGVTDAQKIQREFVYDRYEKFCNLWSWNRKDCAPIIPLVHGTDVLYAKKIAATGFAALSSIDEGWYGKGIYFTSYIIYTLPYIRKRRYPTIILSWVLPGNVYPVIESPKDKSALTGGPIKNRYQSHYILTNREGHPATDPDDDIFDELVVGQESQIAPAFIIEIDSSNFTNLNAKWSNKKGRILANSIVT